MVWIFTAAVLSAIFAAVMPQDLECTPQMKYRSWSSVCRFTTHSRLMYPSALFNLFPSRKHLLAIGVALVAALGPVAAQQGVRISPHLTPRSTILVLLFQATDSDFNLALTPDYSFSDSLQSIINQPQAGFDLGLVASWDATKNLHVRFIPGLSFQDRSLEYRFEEDGGTDLKVRRTESVYLNFPLLLKLRTDRVGNYAAYALVGAKFSKDMQSQEETNQQLGKRLHFAIGIRQQFHRLGSRRGHLPSLFQIQHRRQIRTGQPQHLDPRR